MSTVILDIIGSFILGGILLIMGIKLSLFTSMSNQQSVIDLIAQKNSVQIGKIIEDDFYKIGYHYQSSAPILQADTNKIKFYTDFDNNGTVDSLTYYSSPMLASYARSNPHHMLLYRRYNREAPVIMNLGITKFGLEYYDSFGAQTTSLNKIKAIKIRLEIESDYPSANAGGEDVVYNTIHWELLIVPKSLHY